MQGEIGGVCSATCATLCWQIRTLTLEIWNEIFVPQYRSMDQDQETVAKDYIIFSRIQDGHSPLRQRLHDVTFLNTHAITGQKLIKKGQMRQALAVARQLKLSLTAFRAFSGAMAVKQGQTLRLRWDGKWNPREPSIDQNRLSCDWS